MTDVFSKKKRSEVMSRIRSRDTACEVAVRSLLHRLGYRFRLHARNVFGRPDIVLPRYKTAIFVHGCFWHRHTNCRFAYVPKTRTGFWLKKFASNVTRDKVVRRELAKQGWHALTVWECELARPERVIRALDRNLSVRADAREHAGRRNQPVAGT